MFFSVRVIVKVNQKYIKRVIVRVKKHENCFLWLFPVVLHLRALYIFFAFSLLIDGFFKLFTHCANHDITIYSTTHYLAESCSPHSKLIGPPATNVRSKLTTLQFWSKKLLSINWSGNFYLFWYRILSCALHGICWKWKCVHSQFNYLKLIWVNLSLKVQMGQNLKWYI